MKVYVVFVILRDFQHSYMHLGIKIDRVCLELQEFMSCSSLASENPGAGAVGIFKVFG
jgi:hypothetical protein